MISKILNQLRSDFLPKTSSISDDSPDQRVLEGRRLFIGLGAMKSGTTWVSQFLRGHPEVYHSPVNEMNFFNRLDDNPLAFDPLNHWRMRTRETLLQKAWSYPPPRKQYEFIKAIAELEVATSESDYLDFFARRIGNKQVFGEICPQYALLTPELYRRIEGMGLETRLMFFMRDPTERLASHIQHKLRFSNFDIDAHIDKLTEDSSEIARSDYTLTFEQYAEANISAPMETFIYEDFFNDQSIERLCRYLGIRKKRGDFSKQVNVSRGKKITSDQKDRIRDKLDPVYRRLHAHFGEDRPTSWRW